MGGVGEPKDESGLLNCYWNIYYAGWWVDDSGGHRPASSDSRTFRRHPGQACGIYSTGTQEEPEAGAKDGSCDGPGARGSQKVA